MSSLVDVLGFVAGAIWMCSAIYFQMVRTRSVHPAYVASLFLIGVALMMGSSALALRDTQTVQVLAIAGNVLFIALGLGVWYALESAADLQDRKVTDPDDVSHQ